MLPRSLSSSPFPSSVGPCSPTSPVGDMEVTDKRLGHRTISFVYPAPHDSENKGFCGDLCVLFVRNKPPGKLEEGAAFLEGKIEPFCGKKSFSWYGIESRPLQK